MCANNCNVPSCKNSHLLQNWPFQTFLNSRSDQNMLQSQRNTSILPRKWQWRCIRTYLTFSIQERHPKTRSWPKNRRGNAAQGKNRELDKKSKERSAINKDIWNGPSKRRKSTTEEEDIVGRAEGRNKTSVVDLLNHALALEPGRQSFLSRGWERRPGA